MKILFVCRHNRFRSKLAEGFFNKYNKKKNNKAISRGVFKDINVANSVVKIAREKKIKLSGRISRPMTRNEMISSDLIVIVANDVPKSLFPGKKVLVWKFADTDQRDVKEIRKTAEQIEKKVKGLIRRI